MATVDDLVRALTGQPQVDPSLALAAAADAKQRGLSSYQVNSVGPGGNSGGNVTVTDPGAAGAALATPSQAPSVQPAYQPSAVDAMVRSLTAGQSQPDADANLGGTLNVAGFNTGIPLPPAVEAGIVSAGKMTSDALAGVKQAYNWATGNTAANDQLARQQAADAAAYTPLEQAHPVASFVGPAAPMLAALPLTGGALAASALAAAPGLVSYGSPAERGVRSALGAGLSALGYGAGSLAGKLLGPGSADMAAAVGNQWGIPLSASQVTDSGPVKIADAVLSNLPGSSGPIRQAGNATFAAWNKAVSNTFGADSTQLTPQVIGAAKNAAGNALGDIADRNTLAFDQPLSDALDAVKQRAALELGQSDAGMVNNQVNHILSQFGPDNTMPGTAWKGINSTLGDVSSQGGPVGHVVGDLRAGLQDAMDRSMNPADQAAWRLNAKNYYNALQVGNATKGSPGVLKPQQLLTQVNAFQSGARYGAGNDLAQVAQWGQQMLPNGVPNSGTAQRLLYQKILTNPLTGLAELGAGAWGVDKMGGDLKDMAVTGAIGYPLLWALGKGAASPALASYMSRAPISPLVQRLLSLSGAGTGMLGSQAIAPNVQQPPGLLGRPE